MIDTMSSKDAVGSITYVHKGKTIVSNVGSKKFDKFSHSLHAQSYQIGNVPPEYAYRPDLIAYIWYGSTDFWWKIMMINSFFDPFESLNTGTQMLLPKV